MVTPTEHLDMAKRVWQAMRDGGRPPGDTVSLLKLLFAAVTVLSNRLDQLEKQEVEEE